MECMYCIYWRRQSETLKPNYGLCAKLLMSDKVDFIINNGEDIIMAVTDEDFYCFHFKKNRLIK